MKILLLLLITVPIINGTAQSIDTLVYCVDHGKVGVGGYDPVSYFKSGKPLPGKVNIALQHDGVEYRFATLENRNAFKSKPESYLPQFGGWCSMTLALGRATRPVYDNFLIRNGKLYLFERTLSVNGKELWLTDPVTNQKKASTNYLALKTRGKI